MFKHSNKLSLIPIQDQSEVALVCREALAAHAICAASEVVISSRMEGLAEDIQEEFLKAKRGRDAAIRAVRLCPSRTLQDIHDKAKFVSALSSDLGDDPRIGVMSLEVVKELLRVDLTNFL